MTIQATVVADSIPLSNGVIETPRLLTFKLRYPRFIHAEVMTHRTFSRNASSSRAIPVERLIMDVVDDPAIPIHWGRNKPGMQADEESDALVSGEGVTRFDTFDNAFDAVTPEQAWLHARDVAVRHARAFAKAEFHKQVANRLLEPFAHINVVVTATDYDNFYWLRRHADAQPEIRALADAMWDAQQQSTPKTLGPGEWHLPFVSEEDRAYVHQSVGWDNNIIETPISTDELIAISIARCARVSYLTHDGKKPNLSSDLDLHRRLVGSAPLHASPAEHQATPDDFIIDMNGCRYRHPHLSGNFDAGWIQHRKTLTNERMFNYTGTQ